MSSGDGASDGTSLVEREDEGVLSCAIAKFALLATRLLYAGHPLQPSAPPVPLQRPPPGHEPLVLCSAAIYVAVDGVYCAGEKVGDACCDVSCEVRCGEIEVVGARFRFVGLEALRAFK